ncbi:MAG TPA: S-formylglutathione hydrolase [Devosia sp.]|jgi:S-formylglutathione hydrolase|nr:S-formylglutathione hydrolase [Devosia sp.]
METVSQSKAHGGIQGVYRHQSAACACPMTFAVFVPPHNPGQKLPVLWYLSGLTCTHANAMDKGEYRQLAAELGLVIVLPDTSPRGPDVPDEPDNWKFGCGAGFYLDATEAPYASNYRMATYIGEELPALVAEHFPVDMARQGIFGHSMGGHGAMIMALNHPDRFRSCSAFAPIVAPSVAEWSQPALKNYLGNDQTTWRRYDATALVEDGRRFDDFLIDQGTADSFLETGLMPWRFEEACKTAGQRLTLRMQEGYDHSYNFISTFMDDHLRWHAERLR